MPKATAVWLIENTTLTFEQIGEFCGMHSLEVQGIADGDVATAVIGIDPVANGQLSRENLEAAIKDSSVKLKLRESAKEYIDSQKQQKKRYTPVARRQDKPDAVAWLIKHHPELTDAQIVKLIGTTKNTIKGLRERTHWNIQNIRPRDPVLLGLCLQSALETTVKKAREAQERKGGAKSETATLPEEPEKKVAQEG